MKSKAMEKRKEMEWYTVMAYLQTMLHLLSIHSMAMDVGNQAKVKRKLNLIMARYARLWGDDGWRNDHEFRGEMVIYTAHEMVYDTGYT